MIWGANLKGYKPPHKQLDRQPGGKFWRWGPRSAPQLIRLRSTYPEKKIGLLQSLTFVSEWDCMYQESLSCSITLDAGRGKAGRGEGEGGSDEQSLMQNFLKRVSESIYSLNWSASLFSLLNSCLESKKIWAWWRKEHNQLINKSIVQCIVNLHFDFSDFLSSKECPARGWVT